MKKKAPENWESKAKKAKEKQMGWPDFTPKADKKKGKKRGK